MYIRCRFLVYILVNIGLCILYTSGYIYKYMFRLISDILGSLRDVHFSLFVAALLTILIEREREREREREIKKERELLT